MKERYVNNVLKSKGIVSINQLNVKDLADAFDIQVYYFNCDTHLAPEDELYCFIDIRANPIEQYEQFLHEIAHLIYTTDVRGLTDMTRWQYMEGKVDSLIPYIAIPKFATPYLKDCETTSDVAEMFGISNTLAEIRIEKLKNKMIVRGGLYESRIIRKGFYRTTNRKLQYTTTDREDVCILPVAGMD